MKRWSFVFLCFIFLTGSNQAQTVDPFDVLVFTKTLGYRHKSIPDGVTAVPGTRQWGIRVNRFKNRFF